jgi:hypothetical protein
MLNWQEKELIRLSNIEPDKRTKQEKKLWNQLNILFDKEQLNKKYESWKANQPI